MSNERFYVTTPIYYVNDRPHIGHAYSSVLADVMARYHRLLGIPTWFLTGTDEHGQKVQDSAEARGVTPQEHVDEMVVHFRDLLGKLGVANDDFIRTTEPRHTTIVRRVLASLHERGDIYLGKYEGWYCTRCERYWTDKEVQERGGGKCPEMPDRHDVTWLAEENYYFRMSKYVEPLREAIASGAIEILPEKRRNEVLGFLDQGLTDLCISRNRERLQWGVELPFDANFVSYVWVDALFNYKTAIGYLADDAAQQARHASWWPADVHLIGKEILKEHAVYWPTMLLAMGEALPRRILAHGWLLDPHGGKLSKSKLLRADADSDVAPAPTIEQMLEVFGVDGTRWFIATAGKPTDDMAFNWDIVRERLNTDLANGIGNSANRLLKMASTTCDGAFPALTESDPRDDAVRDATLAAVAEVRRFPETLDVMAVTAAVRVGIDAISLYLSDTTPWKLVKTESGIPRAAHIIGHALDALRILNVCASPIVPAAAERLRAALGGVGDVDFDAEARFGGIPRGTTLGAPPNLFPRVPPDAIPALPA